MRLHFSRENRPLFSNLILRCRAEISPFEALGEALKWLVEIDIPGQWNARNSVERIPRRASRTLSEPLDLEHSPCPRCSVSESMRLGFLRRKNTDLPLFNGRRNGSRSPSPQRKVISRKYICIGIFVLILLILLLKPSGSSSSKVFSHVFASGF